MRSICMECSILFDVKEPYEQDDETHGYCDECFSMVLNNIAGLRSVRAPKKLKEDKSNE